eukprot:SAG11_NODE_1136_length_5731_cov_23.656250_4_plen_54_part_00
MPSSGLVLEVLAKKASSRNKGLFFSSSSFILTVNFQKNQFLCLTHVSLPVDNI